MEANRKAMNNGRVQAEPVGDVSLNKLRVALLTPAYWPEVRRGTERLVADTAAGLLARGHLPRVATSHPGRPERVTMNGVEVVRSWRPPDGWLERLNLEEHLTHVPFTYLTLLRGDDDVAHAFFVTDAIAAARWSRRRCRPLVLSYGGIPDRRGLLLRRRRLELTQRAVSAAAAVTTSSRAAADAFARWLGVQAEVVYPGVDTSVFEPGPGRDDSPSILCAAAMEEPRKRLGLLLRAFERVRRERPGTRLLLVRPERPLAEKLSEVAGVELVERRQSAGEMAALYRRAWVSVLPAVAESFGMVLAEALACGTPAVGSRHGGIPEIVDRPKVGRLFEDDAAEDGLARALLEGLELASDAGTAAACVERASEFARERSVAAYERIYRRALGT
jgi:phosphatidylinositol alpha-mannosyltransferase